MSLHEQETIIRWDKEGDLAEIYTYEKTWQKHLEDRLKLNPVSDDGFGGKTYEIAKERIRPPRAPKKLSAKTREGLRKRGQALRKTSSAARNDSCTNKPRTRKPQTIPQVG